MDSVLDLNRFGIELLVYGFNSWNHRTIQFQIRAQHDAMKSLELQRQNSLPAHLRALQMQLETALSLQYAQRDYYTGGAWQQKEATEMLAHLNAILKSTLTRTTPEKVPISQEWRLWRATLLSNRFDLRTVYGSRLK